MDPSVAQDCPVEATMTNSRIGLRGWLLAYMVGLTFQAVHNLGLTVGAIVIYAHPALGGMTTHKSIWDLLFYILTNLAIVTYTAVVLLLMIRRRKAAIMHNV